MKYLYKINESSDSLYQEFSLGQFMNEIKSALDIGNKFVSFTENEKSQIKKLFGNYKGHYYAEVTHENALALGTPFGEIRNFFGTIDGVIIPSWMPKVDNLIYVSGGENPEHNFIIARDSDEWFYICYKKHSRKTTTINMYFKCDQTDGFIALLKTLTKNVRVVDKEKEKIKWDRQHKMSEIISRLKYLSWEEFQKFYYEFTGKKKE